MYKKTTQKLVVSAARRNGLMGYLDNLISTLGNWKTYEGVKSPQDLMTRFSQVTMRFVGLDFGQEGGLQIKGILLGILAIHALEQITGGTVTLTTRLFLRGQVLGAWGGVIVRQNPLTPKKARLLGFISGGLVSPHPIGVYWHEGGRTWEAESFGLNIKGNVRAITRIGSLSVPRREHFFDRPLIIPGMALSDKVTIGADGQARGVPIQSVIDIVLGQEHPHNVPGYIGSTNDLENVVSALGWAKRLLFMISWFLIDESERDVPLSNLVDYASVNGTQKRATTGASSTWANPAYGRKAGGSTVYPSTTVPQSGYVSPQSIQGVQLSFDPTFTVPPAPARPDQPPPEDTPYRTIKDRIKLGDKFYPVLIKSILRHPIHTDQRVVDAIFYDPADRQWKSIADPNALTWLLQQVQTGRMAITTDWQFHL